MQAISPFYDFWCASPWMPPLTIYKLLFCTYMWFNHHLNWIVIWICRWLVVCNVISMTAISSRECILSRLQITGVECELCSLSHSVQLLWKDWSSHRSRHYHGKICSAYHMSHNASRKTHHLCTFVAIFRKMYMFLWSIVGIVIWRIGRLSNPLVFIVIMY